MGSTYTVEQLLAMRRTTTLPRPSYFDKMDVRESNLLGTYLSIFRKYTRTIAEGPEAFRLKYQSDSRIVYKYEFALSNKEFKRRWVKTHNTSAGLKDLPRIPVRVFSLRVRFLEEYFRAVSRIEKSLSRLLNRIHIRPSQVEVEQSPSKYVIPARRETREVQPVKAGGKRAVHLHVDPVHRESYFRVIGGLTYTYHPDRPPPKREWTKYWYYFRKRGLWRPSEHHPYGDEKSIIKHVYDATKDV